MYPAVAAMVAGELPQRTIAGRRGRIISVTPTAPTHMTAITINGGREIEATFRAHGLHGQTTGRLLAVTEYHGGKYQSRIDYPADVYGKRDAK